MTFKRLLTYLKPYKKTLIIILLVVLSSSIITIITPKLLGNIITSLYSSITKNATTNDTYIYTLIIILSSLYLTSSILTYYENYLMSNLCEKIIYKLRNETNEKLSKLKINYFDTHEKGDILTKINNDIDALSSLFIQTIPSIIKYTITFIGILIIMSLINTTITLISIIMLPITLIISKIFMKLSKSNYKKYYSKNGNLNSLIEESYRCKNTISLYNKDQQIYSSFKQLNKDLAKTNLKATFTSTIISPISSLINYLVYLIIIILGSKYVLQKKILLGDIQALIQYTKQLSSPINNFSSLITSLQSSIASAERVFELLDEDEEIYEGIEELKEINKIEFKDVQFSYDNSPLINNFNLTINKGDKIAIVGENGSGKSTIINLLLQFYKIKKGNILINNKSIYNYDINSCYNKISLVPQNIWLLNDTIKNNITFGNNHIKDDELIKICNKISDINITKNMQSLSIGEKQLLTITRSLIKDHDLLILDEATSNIDSKTELTIQELINKLDKEKTVITIAHRLSTITKADKIIVLKDGKIIETGNHSSLYRKKGEYYNFLQSL